MGAGRRVHHEGTKGMKIRTSGMIRVFCGLALIANILAALPPPLRAGEPVDAKTLRLAQRMAVSEWERALPFAMLRVPAERQMPPGTIGTLHWVHGVVGFVSSDLRGTNPGREADILVYINSILIPEMDARRDAYVCGYSRLYYSFGKQWIQLQGIVDSLPDEFAAISYFIAPTRDYLQERHLSLSPVMQRQLERDARFSPDGTFWHDIAALRDHIPCDSGADGTRKSFGVRL
jgi:hypothetical protein